MNSIETIIKYSANGLDKVYAAESKTAILGNGKKWVDVNFNEAGYVKIANLLFDGLGNYNKARSGEVGEDYAHYQNGTADGFPVGDVALKWETYKLNYKRGRQFQIDEIDNEETAGLMIGNLASEFTRVAVVREADAICFSKLAEVGYNKSEDLTKEDIISNLLDAFAYLNDNEVPEEDQILYVSSKVNALIEKSPELTRYITQTDLKNGDITLHVKAFMGRPLIVVPSNRFITNVKVTDNGFGAGTNSKAINYIVVDRKGVQPIVKFEKIKVFSPEVVQDFNGYKVNYLVYHDVIIPENKRAGIYVSVSASTDGSSVSANVSVSQKAGAATNGLIITSYATKPTNLLGTLVYSASAITLGAKPTSPTTITLGKEFTVGSATEGYFAITDGSGIAIAVSGKTALSKKTA